MYSWSQSLVSTFDTTSKVEFITNSKSYWKRSNIRWAIVTTGSPRVTFKHSIYRTMMILTFLPFWNIQELENPFTISWSKPRVSTKPVKSAKYFPLI
jgi:hypothetical protein